MALSNKQDIKTAIQHSVTLPEELKSVVETTYVAADAADEGDLEEMQEILRLIADADYERGDLI
jgi:hypothetical protein